MKCKRKKIYPSHFIMPLFWIFILAVNLVNCESSDEYRITDVNAPKAVKTPFKVYWNVPTKQCRYQKNSIPFDNLLRKYGITYNKNDLFDGESITIIYDGGYIPAILKRDGNKYFTRNGGLPQNGDLELHLTAFRETVNRLIPDPAFKGVGVIDMENWRPIFRQHWGTLTSITDLSLSIEQRQFWWWPTSWIKMEAAKRFEDAARTFMEKTLITAKQMRPNAVWGYYGFPYCFNMNKDMMEDCAKATKDENDRTYWLWAESTALYPSVYSYSSFTLTELQSLVRGRLTEANRVKRIDALVLPYFWLKYRDGGFIKENDLKIVFETLQEKKASGLIIWGSSADVNQFGKCEELYDYVNRYLGPYAKKYIKRINTLNEDTLNKNVDSTNLGVLNNNTVVTTNQTPVNNTQTNTIPNTPKKVYNKTKTSETINASRINNTHSNTIKNDSIKVDNKTTTPENINEQDQLKVYFYETDENKADTKPYNESESWNLSTYSANRINHTIPYDESNKTKNENNSTQLEPELQKTFYSTDSNKTNTDYSENVIWSIIEYNPDQEMNTTEATTTQSSTISRSYDDRQTSNNIFNYLSTEKNNFNDIRTSSMEDFNVKIKENFIPVVTTQATRQDHFIYRNDFHSNSEAPDKRDNNDLYYSTTIETNLNYNFSIPIEVTIQPENRIPGNTLMAITTKDVETQTTTTIGQDDNFVPKNTTQQKPEVTENDSLYYLITTNPNTIDSKSTNNEVYDAELTNNLNPENTVATIIQNFEKPTTNKNFIFEITTAPNSEVPDSEKNDNSDYLITVETYFNKSKNMKNSNIDDVGKTETNNLEQALEITSEQNSKGTNSQENDISDYLITVQTNFNNSKN